MDGPLKLTISADQWERAERLFEEIPADMKTSIRKDRRFPGVLGEVMVVDFLKLFDDDVERVGKFEYDVRFKRRRIEVKTQVWNARVNENRRAKIPLNSRNDPDIYVFLQFPKSFSVGSVVHLIGWITKERFLSEAEQMLIGDTDGPLTITTPNHECNFVYYNQLTPFKF